MKIIKFPEINIEKSNNGIVAVLGKFEGMHLGHLELLKKGREIANENNLELLIMMFSQKAESNFYSFEERVMFANASKIDYVLEFEPNKENLSFNWKQFNEYLLSIGVKSVVCGHDFRYGQNREGSIETLSKDFEVLSIDEFKIDGASIRTSLLYESLDTDDLLKYKDTTGHYFFYKGIVVRGLGNGRKFGMPTANVEYPSYKINVNEGIYYSYVIYEGQRLPSLTSISTNPTLNADKVTYETYIYNFDEDIYDKEIYVELIEKFREPIKFESIEKLIDQLEEDKVTGKKYFNLN